MNDPMFFEKFELSSGLKVFFQRRNIGWFGSELVVNVGQRYDPPGKEELSHLLEHCLASGTQGLPKMTLPEYQRWVDGQEFDFDFGVTGLDFTAYGGKAPSGRLDDYFAFLSTYALRPALDGGIDHERAIIRAERREKSSPRARKIERRRLRALFGGHRLASAQGWASDKVLAGLTLDDVRRHHRRYYQPANMKLVVAGGLDIDALLKALERMFGGYRDPNWIPYVLPPVEFRRPRPSEYHSKLPGGNPDSVIIQYYWCLPPGEKALVTLARNGLMELAEARVRERLRLAYGVDADTSFYQDHAILALKTEVAPKMVAKTRAALDAAIGEVDALVEGLPRLIEGFRRGLNFLEFPTATAIDVAAVSAVSAEPRTTLETMADVQAVTADEFRRFFEFRVNPGLAYVEMVEV